MTRMRKNAKEEKWAQQVAIRFKEELPAEYLQYLKENEDYILPVIGEPLPMKKRMSHQERIFITAENAARQVLNQYYTNLIRQHL